MGLFDKAEQLAKDPKNVELAITKYKQIESSLVNMKKAHKGSPKTAEQKLAEKNLQDQLDVIWWVIKAADRLDEIE